MNKPTCRTCPYWLEGEEVNEGEEIPGECHRTSPVDMVLGDGVDTMWPKVCSWDWCGEHPHFTKWMSFPKSPEQPEIENEMPFVKSEVVAALAVDPTLMGPDAPTDDEEMEEGYTN